MDYSSLIESIVNDLLDEGLRNELQAIGLSREDLKTIGNIRKETSKRIGNKVFVTSRDILTPSSAVTKGLNAFIGKHKEALKDSRGYVDPDSPRAIRVHLNPLGTHVDASVAGLNSRDAVMDLAGHEFAHHLTDHARRQASGDEKANAIERQILVNDDERLKDEGQTWRAYRELSKDLGISSPKASNIKHFLGTYAQYRR